MISEKLVNSGLRRLAWETKFLSAGVQLARGLRLIGMEGELVAGLGHMIQQFYGHGITFPLGYTNGAQLYLPTESMLDEGGYEVDSYYQYGFPAPFARGFEGILLDALKEMKNVFVEDR